MQLTGGDLEAFAGVEDEVVMFDFEGQFALEHVEELTRMNMVMPDFTGPYGHQLFDDA